MMEATVFPEFLPGKKYGSWAHAETSEMPPAFFDGKKISAGFSFVPTTCGYGIS